MTWTPPTEGAIWTPGQPTAPVPEPITLVNTKYSDEPQGGLVKAWSASTLDKFENCPYSVFLSKVKKIPEVAGTAADRGTAIHTLAETFVKSEIEELPTELRRYENQFNKLRNEYTIGNVSVEQDWAFDFLWQAVGWADPQTWARMKLDACHLEDDTSARVIDFKTGKKWGNEIKHNRQASIYALGAFYRYSNIEFVTTEFWYLDQPDAPTLNHYNRTQIRIIGPRIEARAIKLTSCIDFSPKPSESACRWCSYATDESCEWSYKK